MSFTSFSKSYRTLSKPPCFTHVFIINLTFFCSHPFTSVLLFLTRYSFHLPPGGAQHWSYPSLIINFTLICTLIKSVLFACTHYSHLSSTHALYNEPFATFSFHPYHDNPFSLFVTNSHPLLLLSYSILYLLHLISIPFYLYTSIVDTNDEKTWWWLILFFSSLRARFFEKLQRKLTSKTVYVIVKSKSTTIFHGLYSCQS